MTASQNEGSTPIYEVHGPRATIRLNRPRHHNRLQPEDLVALMALFDQVEADPAVRVLVLTGTGRSFSSGYDLGSIAKRQASGQQQIAGTSFEAVTNRLEELSVPTICRLNGGVYGGATDLALSCDFRIAIDTVEMFMPAARLGLHYYKDGIKRYVSRLGADNARMLFLTARKIGAPEMLRIGYLTAVAPADRLDAEVNALADVIGANAPNAMAGMKRTINEFARGELDEAAADARHRASMQSDEVKEGVAAFAEKRAPRFSGSKS